MSHILLGCFSPLCYHTHWALTPGLVAIIVDIRSSMNYLVYHEEVLQRLAVFTGHIANVSDGTGQDLLHLLGNHAYHKTLRQV